MADPVSPPPPAATPTDAKSAKAEAKTANARAKALRPWYKKKRSIFSGIIALVIIIIIITVSAGMKSTVTSGPTAAPPKSKSVAHVGTTLTLGAGGGGSERVTLVQVIDPAQGAGRYITADPGKRFVAAVFNIMNTSEVAGEGNANDDAALIGSDNQTYTFNPYSLTECTNFSEGQFQLGPSESATGCVAFQMPTGVSVVKVQWSPNAGFASDFGEWLVP
jgi:hypothetical protein